MSQVISVTDRSNRLNSIGWGGAGSLSRRSLSGCLVTSKRQLGQGDFLECEWGEMKIAWMRQKLLVFGVEHACGLECFMGICTLE